MSTTVTLPDWAEHRRAHLGAILQQLLSSASVAFDDRLHSRLPEKHGIYAIYAKNQPGEFLRAGGRRLLREVFGSAYIETTSWATNPETFARNWYSRLCARVCKRPRNGFALTARHSSLSSRTTSYDAGRNTICLPCSSPSIAISSHDYRTASPCHPPRLPRSVPR